VLENQSDNLPAQLNKDHKDEKAMHLKVHEAKTLFVSVNQPYE